MKTWFSKLILMMTTINKYFGVGSRNRDMALWDEPNIEC